MVSFPRRISLVNVKKTAENCRFVHIYYVSPWQKTSFLYSFIDEQILNPLNEFVLEKIQFLNICNGVIKLVEFHQPSRIFYFPFLNSQKLFLYHS